MLCRRNEFAARCKKLQSKARIAKKSGLHRCKPLFVLVLMGGIEPSTY